MTLKLLGVIIVIVSCGGVGLNMAASYRRTERSLRELLQILDYMECELEYRLTPLPDLCKQIAAAFPGALGQGFRAFAAQLELQENSDTARCMLITLGRIPSVPEITKEMLKLLGRSIGCFDLSGQLKGISFVRQEARRNLDVLEQNRDSRIRSYQTLGLCAGAALAILLV